jgi:hypothetical protein
VLAQAGVTAYVITLAESASAPERTAATELATYLKQVTGVEFAVVAPPAAAGRPVIAVGPGAAKGVASLTETLDKAADGAYRTYDLGVHDLKAGMYFWAAPMGKADEVDSVFVDRLFCVREKALRKR